MVDIPGNATTTSTISVGGSVSDTLEVAGDHDWFRITLTAGEQISVFVQGLTLADPYVRIRNAAGTIIYQNDDGGAGLNSFVAFQVPSTGTYYIDVSSAPETQTGTYQISVAPFVQPPIGTIDDIANQLTHGYWDGDFHHFDVTTGGSITVNLTGIDASGAAVARQALALWTDIIGVNFVEVATGGQIVFGQANEGTGAFSTAEWSNGITSSATVNVAPSRLNLHTYLHEIAHALGLGHAGDYNGGTAFSRYPYEAMWRNDGDAVSIMSYFDNGENSYYAGLGFSNYQVVTPQLADIVAMGNLYGLSTTTRTGDTIYGFNNNSGRDIYSANLNPNVSYTIFDSGGIDTLDYSGFGNNQRINLNAEEFSNVGPGVGNVSIARGVVIENAIGGSGNDVLIGNASANVLTGGPGVNTLTGGAGNDIFRDLAGNLSGDTITDFGAGDLIVFTNASLGSFTYSLSGTTLTFSGGSLTLQGVSGSLVASAAAGGGVQLAIQALAPFTAESLVLNAFGYSAGGWTSNNTYPRSMADVNGDGRADIVGLGNDGVFVALSLAGGGFAPSQLASVNFGAATTAGGWTNNNIYPRMLADVNGDSRADVVAFGEGGTYVALGQANGNFGNPVVATGQFGRSTAAGGWTSNDVYHRELADVNGDGRADIVGFGNDGVYVALGQANGTFASAQVASVNFGYNAGAGGWTSDNIYPRRLADVNGDGRADVVAFGEGGTYVALGQLNGTFGAPILASGEFGHGASAGSWTSNDTFYRELADVNHDGRADIVGFGQAGTFVSLGQTNGSFAPAQFVSGNFGAGAGAGGWSSQDTFPRHLADVNHDGFADIVGFGANGAYLALGQPSYWF